MNTLDILKRQPWHIAYVNIGQRCTNKNHPKFKFYGGKGIKRSITSTELKTMYDRDNAHLMKSPSVDRIDTSKDYCVSNCRFIEMDENRKLANDARTQRITIRSISKARDLIGNLNRPNMQRTDMHPKDVENIYSPPYKDMERKTKEYNYPPQISGVRPGKKRQRINVQGNTGGNTQFGGISGAGYGVNTGGSYRT